MLHVSYSSTVKFLVKIMQAFAIFLLLLHLLIGGIVGQENKSVVTTSSGPGGVQVQVYSFEYGAGTIIHNSQNINGNDGSGGGLARSGEDVKFLFGVSFSPYTSFNGKENNAVSVDSRGVTTMLKIIKTKANSLMTNSMGVPDPKFTGTWNKGRSEGLISTAAAELNQKNNSLSLKVLQGARLFKNEKKQLDVDNAFLSAESANKLYPGTVWGISLNVDNEWGYIQDASEMSQVLAALTQQGYKRRAIEHDIQIGTKMDICSEIVDGKEKNLLIELASACNFIVCSVYPPFGTEKAEDGVVRISNTYQRYSQAFAKVNPRIDIGIATGWASEGDSDFNYKQSNTPKVQAKFWAEMKKWAEGAGVRVYMHEAFDQPLAKGKNYRHMGLWAKVADGSGKYVEKLTNKPLGF